MFNSEEKDKSTTVGGKQMCMESEKSDTDTVHHNPSRQLSAIEEDNTASVDIEKQGGSEVQSTAAHSSEVPPSKGRAIALVLTLTGAAFLNSLGVQACVIILPKIGKHLNIPAARQQWVISAYSLTFGCFLLLWGRLADVYGKRPIFLWGSAWVCLVTLVCPFVPNEIGFDILRGLQGLGAAANVPTAIGILGVTFPPSKAKTYAFATYAAGAPLGNAFGNIIGGIVGEYASWKWVFWILAIFAAIVTVAGWYLIPILESNSPEADIKHAVDWLGGGLITVGLLILLFALTEGNIVGFGTGYIIALIIVSLLLTALFAAWQLYLEKKTTRPPLMKVTIFRNLGVSAAMVIMGLFFAAFNNFLVFATYFYQDYHGLSTIDTTLRFLPTGVGGVLTVAVTSQLLGRVNAHYIIMFGTLCCSISNLLFAVPIPPDTLYWAYGFPAMCLVVFGADALFPSLLLYTTQSLPQKDQAIGGAMVNAVGQIGRAIGLAVATAIQVAVQESKQGHQEAISNTGDYLNEAFLQGNRSANWFSFGICLASFGIAAVAFKGVGKVGAVKR